MPTFIQEKDSTFGTVASSAPIAYTSNNALGNLLIAVASWFNAATSAGNTATLTVSDTQGNLWKPIPSRRSSSGKEVVQFWYATNCKAGANTVNFAFTGDGSGAGVTFSAGVVAEYSGVNALDNFDNETSLINSGTGTAINPTNSRAAATHDSTELVIGYAQSESFSTWTATDGYTLRSTAASFQLALEDQNAGNGSYASQFSIAASAILTWGVVTFYQTDSSTFVQELDHDDGSAANILNDVMTFTQNVKAGDLLFLNAVFLTEHRAALKLRTSLLSQTTKEMFGFLCRKLRFMRLFLVFSRHGIHLTAKRVQPRLPWPIPARALILSEHLFLNGAALILWTLSLKEP